MGFVLVLGGARSGKSDYAQRLGAESGRAVSLIATATAEDDEMVERIRRHRASRSASWTTVEEPIDMLAAIQSVRGGDFVIVDCLTLWVANLLGAGRSGDDVVRCAEAVAAELASREGVVVTNEVGLGIVPANALAREFRDVLGRVNAIFANHAHASVLMVAGRRLELA